MPDDLRQWFKQQGAIGGKLRWQHSTPEQRSAYMRALAAKRKNPGRKRKPRTNSPTT